MADLDQGMKRISVAKNQPFPSKSRHELRACLSSIKPDSGRDEINSGQEVAGGFIVTGGDGSELLEFAEKVLDQVSVLLRWNNDHFPCGLQGFNHPESLWSFWKPSLKLWTKSTA